MKFILIIAAHFTFLLSFAQDSIENLVYPKYIPVETTSSFKLGSTIISVKVFQYGNTKDIVFINLHDNETTSVDAAKIVLEEEGGLLVKIENQNNRMLGFELNKRQYVFDPNRMFTKKGITANLKKNKAYSTVAVKKLQGFASFVLKKIPHHTTTLIALHNNDEGNLSITSYTPGEIYETDAAQVYINNEQDPDNFFLTTDKALFSALTGIQYNVILQENTKAKDDGSLSIYYGRRKKNYVNIEAELWKLDEQKDMIKMLLSVIIVKKG